MSSKAKLVQNKPFDEIVGQLNDNFQLTVQKPELLNPEADKMLHMYVTILNEVMDIEDLCQPTAEYTFDPNLRGTDNIEDIIPYCNVYSILKSNDFLIPNVQFGDIINPTSKRVQIILSCLLNFFMFSCTRRDQVEYVNEKFKFVDETKNKMEVEGPQLQKLINDAVSEKFNSDLQLKQKSKRRDEFTKLCAQALNAKSEIDIEMDFVKKRQSETEQKLAQSDSSREEWMLKIKDLESRILESPENLDKLLEELNTKLNQLQCELNQNEKKSKNTRIAVENCSNWIQEVLDIAATLKSISEKMDENMSFLEEKKKNETVKQQILEGVNDAEMNLKVVTEKESKIREQNHVNVNKHHLEIASLQASINEAKKSLEKLKSDNLERDHDSKKFLMAIETLSADIANLVSKWQSIEDQFQNSVNSLNDSLDIFNSSAESQMKMFLSMI